MQGIAAAFIAVMLPVLALADEVQIRVTYYSPEIVRIEKTMSEFRTSPSVSVVMEPQDGVKPKVKVKVGEDGTVTFSDASGHRRRHVRRTLCSRNFTSAGFSSVCTIR